MRVEAEGGVTLGLVKDELEKTLRNFRIKDCLYPVQQRKRKLNVQEFVKGWGKREFVVYITKPEEDARMQTKIPEEVEEGDIHVSG